MLRFVFLASSGVAKVQIATKGSVRDTNWNMTYIFNAVCCLLDLLHSDQGKKKKTSRFYRKRVKLLFFHWELQMAASSPVTALSQWQSAINVAKCYIICLDVYIHICKSAFSKKCNSCCCSLLRWWYGDAQVSCCTGTHLFLHELVWVLVLHVKHLVTWRFATRIV